MILRFRFLMLLIFFGLTLQSTPLPGQDVGAIKARLLKAIKANEIDFIHAAAMMEALEQVTEDQRREKEMRRHLNEREHRFELERAERLSKLEYEFKREIEQIELAQAANEITREVAERERAALKREFEARVDRMRFGGGQPDAHLNPVEVDTFARVQDDDHADNSDLAREIFFNRAFEEAKVAVAKGEMTREQARESLALLKNSLWGVNDKRRSDSDVSDKAKEKSNRQSESKEKQRLAKQREQKMFFDRALLQMKQAIEEGRVTPEEGRERLLKLKQRIENASRSGDKDGQ